jgi:hypothetical protein
VVLRIYCSSRKIQPRICLAPRQPDLSLGTSSRRAQRVGSAGRVEEEKRNKRRVEESNLEHWWPMTDSLQESDRILTDPDTILIEFLESRSESAKNYAQNLPEICQAFAGRRRSRRCVRPSGVSRLSWAPVRVLARSYSNYAISLIRCRPNSFHFIQVLSLPASYLMCRR